RRLGVRHVHEVTEPIVVLWPIDEGDVAGVSAVREVGAVGEAAVGPQVEATVARTGGVKADGPFLERPRLAHAPTQQLPRPRGSHVRDVLPPEVVLSRLRD